MTEIQRSRLSGLCCGALAGLAVLLCLPFAPMGFIDDWSYIRTAYIFAQTGHFIYNGWATAMLGWQIVWTAPFLKAFGYSFNVARLSMLPFAFGCGWLIYVILRHSNISNRNAVFGSLTFCLSPLMLPLAASYMSDVGGLFVILMCFYMCQRALEAKSDRAAILWLVAATVINVAGGTERQIIWLGALLVVPSAVWLMRRRRGVVQTAVVLWVFSVASIFYSTHWFYRQPYSVPERIIYPPLQDPTQSTASMIMERLRALYVFNKSIYLSIILLKTFLCLLLIILPVLIAWLVVSRKLSRRAQIRLGVLAVLLGIGCWLIMIEQQGEEWFMPWLYHVLDSEGIIPTSWDILGQRPVSLSLTARAIISVVVVLSGAAFVEWWFASGLKIGLKFGPNFWRDLRRKFERIGIEPEDNWTGSWQTISILYLPYTFAYLVLLIPRGLRFYIFDRYLLGIMPIVLLYLLKLYEEKIGRSLPVVSYVTLCLFSLYGIFATHDLFALDRARAAAVHAVRSHGVPEEFVQAGFEFDGWSEIDLAGFVNESKMAYPANAYHLNLQDLRRPGACRMGFDQYTPKLHPVYVVVLTPMPCFEQSSFSPVGYRAWLPPFSRRVYIQKVPKRMQDLEPSLPALDSVEVE